MRIYFYCADITFTGGIEKITTTLANYFVSQGMEVTIVSNFRTNEKFSYPLDARVKTDFLSEKAYSGKPGSLLRLKMFLENKRKAESYFKKLHNEIIITQGFPPAFLYFLAMGKRGGNRIINCEHVHYFYYGKIVRALRYAVYKTYNNVCVLTNTDKRQYDKLHIHSVCIPNAVDFSAFPAVDLNAPRKKTIVGIGRLEEQKNFSALIRVFLRVHKVHPDWKLEIYGRGNLQETLQAQIDTLGLSDCASLMGVSDSIGAVLHEAGLFVLSSIYEGFSMVIVEAMASGCPVVSYDCPNGPSGLIADGKNGLLVENQNEEKLYEAIYKMIENPELRAAYSRSALESVRKYGIENVFVQWKALFEKTAGEKGAM